MPVRVSARPYRLIVLERSLELAQRHVGGGSAVVALDVVLVYLQGLGSIRQGIAIALCAQVRQASVAVVDGIGGIDLHSLRVVLDGILIVFVCKERKTLRIEAFNFKLKSYSMLKFHKAFTAIYSWEKLRVGM